MKSSSLLRAFALFVLCSACLTSSLSAQKPGSGIPRQEMLLNGLKLLMWSDPSASDVKVSIRVHSGAAFDPQGKEGVMQLLSDNIFPTAAAKSFFTDDLGGNVEVITNYDYIQINASAKSSEFVTLLETLGQALTNPTIDKETTAAIKKALTEKIVELEKDPVYVAEHSATKRLFGAFPYGRPQLGTVESLQRIDFADLIFAKERFLSADNATVAISGNFNSDLGYRAVRRYFSGWLKSDKRVPSTFRQPDDPDTKPFEIAHGNGVARTAMVFRGIARNDSDYAASRVLEYILKSRLQKYGGGANVSVDARVLPGVVSIGVPGSAPFPFDSFSTKITDSEFSTARASAASDFARRIIFDAWLDADTYRTTVSGDTQAFEKVTLADVQRVADRLSKNPIVSVIVRPATQAQ